MKDNMKKIAIFSNIALSVSLISLGFSTIHSLAANTTASSIEELKSDRIKSLAKRDPRAEELIAKAQTKISELKQDSKEVLRANRLQAALDQISMTSSGMSEARIKADLELLESIVKEHKPPSLSELTPLQERYKNLCDKFDDMIMNKDLDRALHIHDKFIRFTSLGLWDKDKIASELERMEGLVERAPDIPYGRSQLLDSYKNKKLVAIPKLCYLGNNPNEQIYLTGDRRSIGIIDEGCGKGLSLEMTEHKIQGPNGELIDLTSCNNPNFDLPFSPPTSVWLKARTLEGRVPALYFTLADSNKENTICAVDIINGKLDNYFKKNLQDLFKLKTPILLGLISEFDRDAAANSFGSDGKTAYYILLDPKLKELSGEKLSEELKKRNEKGFFSSSKGNNAELCNKYGDPAIPDGPERVRDAWKQFRKIVNESGGESATCFSGAGSFHGNKNAIKVSGELKAGNQIWNRLEYYWPGEGVLDWIGVDAIGTDPQTDPKGANLIESLEGFMSDLRSSSWQQIPVILLSAAPARERMPLNEAAWTLTMFQKIIPATYPNITAIFLNMPNGLTFWSREGVSSFRTNVSSNKAYGWPLRFKTLGKASG